MHVTPPANWFLDGQAGPCPQPLLLQAGPLTMEWEAGGLRYIRFQGCEIVRRVYAAVRDANWGTVPDEITNVQLTHEGDGFRLTFDVQCRQGKIDFSWRGTIVGQPQGRLEFEFDGLAHADFARNRIGFCILHPMELAGTAVEVTRADGSRESCEFPRFIAPENPFKDLTALRYSAGDAAFVQITCEGDLFETEDQRNWSDASFKTFCTPLSRPFPVEVSAGQRIWQRVVIAMEAEQAGEATASAPQVQDKVIRLDIAARPTHGLPKIGLAVGACEFLSDLEAERLRRLAPTHLQLEVSFPGWEEAAVARKAAIARKLKVPLDIVLHLGERAVADVPCLATCLRTCGSDIARWTVFPQGQWWTTRAIIEVYVRALRAVDASIPLGGGTPASFCELNRHRPPIDRLDFVTWSVQPQEHAFDQRSLVETLSAQGAIVASAREFCGDLPLVVGPVTFKKRVNPVATGPWPPEPAPGELPVQVDPRQATLFGAGWTLGSIKYLAESGVAAATYYELIGWKGVMERPAGSPLPERFPSVAGGVFPLYHVLADVAEFAGGAVFPVRSSAPLAVEALAVGRPEIGHVDCLWIANLSETEQEVLAAVAADNVRAQILSADNVLQAMESPEAFRAHWGDLVPVQDQRLGLRLPPYAVARINLR